MIARTVDNSWQGGSVVLFRTVYGPELLAIYTFIADENKAGRDLSRNDVHTAFVPRRADGGFCQTQNVDDALAFLRSAGLIEREGTYQARGDGQGTFRVRLLRAMRRIELGQEEAEHPVDRLYVLLLTELFIRPDRLFVQNLHAEANQLWQVKELGGISREKTQTWKRVMEYLGIGRRAFGGFLCTYSPRLVEEIIATWTEERGTLQAFFESTFGSILPYARQRDGDLAAPVRAPFEHLVAAGRLALFPLQDSPSKPYFGERHLKGIGKKEVSDGR